MLHELKILEQYADDVFNNKKTFEVRYKDRLFNIGDKIHFTVITIPEKLNNEWKQKYVEHPLNYKFYEITYILHDTDFKDGIKAGYCILGIEPYDYDEAHKPVVVEQELFPVQPLPWTYPTYPTFNPPYEITCETNSEFATDYNKLYNTSNLGKDKE